ncbi:hypothetical protein OG558_35495 [Kribbella sp. NBC_01510]|uniref:hypothetical protein n=1 Tax=Kribbella sp. NBC_01510 TaxID=2903581 RepID=UPI0038676A7F
MHRAEPPDGLDEATDALAFVTGVLRELDADGDDSAARLLEALVRIREVRDHLAEWEPRLIEQARAAGTSWAQLAPALGVASRQAAERRYLRINAQAAGAAMTGEQRVQAARDQRASDRAVATWARGNAADLRRLAGQVTALDGLDRSTQESVDRIHDALGDDDSAALLGPLADAGPRLTVDHPRIADRISELGDRADEVRRASTQRPGEARQSQEEGL